MRLPLLPARQLVLLKIIELEMGNTHYSFRLLDMFLSEEELAIQIAEIDCIKIDNVNLPKAGQDQVLQQFTANSAGTDKEYSCLHGLVSL
jgi:hypothetical protein